MPADYKSAYDRGDKTRNRALNLVEQVTDALREESIDGMDAEQAEKMCNAIDAATAGLLYVGDSLREIAAAIHAHA